MRWAARGTGVGAGSLVAVLALTAPALAGPTAPNFDVLNLADSVGEAIAVDDFNQDGLADLASAAEIAGTVQISLGNGAGGFGPATVLGSGAEPTSIASGDLNGDGRQDLAVTFTGDRDDTGPGAVAVFRNTGGGAFEALPPAAIGDRPTAIQFAELNGDGRLDAAVIDARFEAGTVTVLFGDGSGALAPQAPTPTGRCSSDLEASDADADGDVDLAVGDCADPTLVVLTNNGGSFSPQDIEIENRIESFELVDLDGSGRPDIASIASSGRKLVVQPATPPAPGAIGFGARSDQHRFGTRHVALVASDLDGDGKLDLVAGSSRFTYNETAQLDVFRGNGSGELAPGTSFTGPGLGTLQLYPSGSLAIADLDRDGRPDVVSTDSPYGVFLGSARRLPRCAGKPVTIVGRPDDDGIRGSRAVDVVAGGGGEDFVEALDGDDTICGAGGKDFLEAGRGDDLVLGGGARDYLDGDDGDDTLSGGGDNDKLFGKLGDDLLVGGPGDDRCDGSKGKDRGRSCDRSVDIP